MIKIKEALCKQCQEFLDTKIRVLQLNISDLEAGLQSETKSSAGDKHETGRAMLQLEREKLGQQLAEIQKQQQVLNKISPKHEHQKIALGSVVKTTNFNYFISISIGEIYYEDELYYAISSSTPIAKLILSKTEEDTITFKDNTFDIVSVH
ncbi:3-oxoacyl-ACP synthase [Winogradskyella sp. A3E31]|uniref:3-oxoacyl-ACP synthase n=1 Tax=Winogradskyella sp. A3E31 TaxID=3349637 RepID=UPI00398AAF01